MLNVIKHVFKRKGNRYSIEGENCSIMGNQLTDSAWEFTIKDPSGRVLNLNFHEAKVGLHLHDPAVNEPPKQFGFSGEGVHFQNVSSREAARG